MKNVKNMLISILITIIIFILAVFVGNKINLNFKIFPNSFYMHTTMLIMGILAIYFHKDKINFQFSLPKFKTLFLPIIFGLLGGVLGNILMAIIFIVFKVKPQMNPIVAAMNPLQAVIFIFLYASICEEILFRGFLLNALNGLKKSTSIILSALIFSFAHLILLAFGAELVFIIGTIIFTIIMGLIAGYYQKKYDNVIYAIIVHIVMNTPIVILSILMVNLK